MAKIQQDGMAGNSDELKVEPFKVNLEHESRHNGVIGYISPVYETDGWDEGETVEKITMYVNAPIDDLDISDDAKDAAREAIEAHREEIEETNEKRDEAGWDDIEQVPEGVLPFRFYLTASLTRTTQANFSNSKLYDTLEKLGLAEPRDDDDGEDRGGFVLLNREGDEVNPFDDVEEDDNAALNDALHSYLMSNLVGMEVEFEVKNSNRGKDNEYSVVGKLVKLINDPETE